MIINKTTIAVGVVFALNVIVPLVSYALPFTIVPAPGTVLPTSVTAGQTVRAYYSVINNLCVPAAGSFVKYLPPNVIQVVDDPAVPSLCGATFNLQPIGTLGSICTLELLITGAVSAYDPDPHHHLFVCRQVGTTCAGTLFPLNVSVIPSPTPPPPPPPPPIVVTHAISGYYTQNSAGLPTVPLIYRGSEDNWILPSSLTLPSDFDSNAAQTTSVACLPSGSCAAVGLYTSSSLGGFANSLLLVNNDNNWAPATGITYPPAATSTKRLQGAQCSTAICAAVGGYQTTGFQPLILTGSGNTWIYHDAVNLPGDYAQTFIGLNNVSCNTTNCVAAGSYFSSDNNLHPLLVAGSTSGDWSYPTVFNLPANTTAELSAVQCTESICVTVGNYTNGSTFPLIETSVPVTNNWSNTTVTLPVNYGTAGNLNAVSCVDSICTAVGFYETVGGNVFPLIMTGNISAWNSESYFAPGLFTGNLNAISCSSTVCVAVGNYNDGDFDFPLVLFNNGGGWIRSNVTLPVDFSSIIGFPREGLYGVDCTDATCTISGSYTNSNNVLVPIILVGNGIDFAPATNVAPIVNFDSFGLLTSVSTMNNTYKLPFGGV